jgi:hypothetical protein
MHELFVHEAHMSILMSHSGVVKTLNVLHEHFYWPKKNMCKESMINALYVEKLSLKSCRMICILFCLYLVNLW